MSKFEETFEQLRMEQEDLDERMDKIRKVTASPAEAVKRGSTVDGLGEVCVGALLSARSWNKSVRESIKNSHYTLI